LSQLGFKVTYVAQNHKAKITPWKASSLCKKQYFPQFLLSPDPYALGLVVYYWFFDMRLRRVFCDVG